MRRRSLLLAAFAALSVGALSAPAFAQNVPAYVTAAVSDAGRPAADKMRVEGAIQFVSRIALAGRPEKPIEQWASRNRHVRAVGRYGAAASPPVRDRDRDAVVDSIDGHIDYLTSVAGALRMPARALPGRAHSGRSGASADASAGRETLKWHFRDRCK